MKANELMIGDWVSVLAHFLETSTEGTATSGYYNLCRKNCHIGGMNGDLIAIDKICSDVIAYEPIPLTEEILKANGWRYDYIYKIWIYEDEDKMDFCVKIDEIRGISVSLYKDYPIIFINNVHELQHALRLCGLQELADNFKIK